MIRRLVLLSVLLSVPPADGTAQERRAPTLAHGFVLHGIVVDPDARAPIRRARVTASLPGSRDTPTTIVSDGEGRFVFANLPAGSYTISASKPGYLSTLYGQVRYRGPGMAIVVPSEDASPPLTLTMRRGGVITGRVLDGNGEPAVRAQVRALQSRYEAGRSTLAWIGHTGSSGTTDDLGAFRLWGLPPGRYYVSASSTPFTGALPAPGAETRLPAVTFYPNAMDSSSAQPLVVVAGKEVPPITISIGSARAVRVRGRAVKANGDPLEGSVDLVSRDAHGPVAGSVGTIRHDGTFELTRVLPGTYQLTARSVPRDPRDDPATGDVGIAIVTVNNDDVDDVLIVAGKAGVARGRVIADDGSRVPLRTGQISVSTVLTAGQYHVQSTFGPTRINDDHTFELDGLLGTHAFRFNDGAGEWTLKTVWWQDRDVTDAGIAFGPNTVVDGITVVATRASSEVKGTVVDSSGARTSDAWVVAFPADRSLRSSSRWLRAVQPDRQGEYRIANLPAPGHYLLAAVPYDALEEDTWIDPAQLSALSDLAQPLSLGENDRHVLNLQLRR